MPDKRIVAIDSQILNALQLCPQRLKYEFIENRRLAVTPGYFEKGSLMHKMLHLYYLLMKHRPNWALKRIADLCVRKGRKYYIKLAIPVEDCENVVTHFQAYVEKYGREKFKVVYVEKPFARKIYEDDNTIIIYQGMIDLGSQYPNESWITIFDHKTGERDDAPSLLDNQFLGYAWAFDTQNVVINKINFYKEIHTGTDKQQSFRRYTLSYPKDIIEEWVEDTISDAHVLLSYMELGVFNRRRVSCKRPIECPFFSICKQERGAREFIKRSKYIVGKQWDVGKNLVRG